MRCSRISRPGFTHTADPDRLRVLKATAFRLPDGCATIAPNYTRV
jgi:hypothetical protein